MSSVIVTIPTVPERAALLAETVRQWRSLGIDPLVSMQASPGRGELHQGLNARRALTAALDRGANYILYCEDDVLLAPTVSQRLYGLCALNEAVTLYLASVQRHPANARRWLAGEVAGFGEAAVPVTGLRHWFGAQAVLLPAGVAVGVAASEQPHGIDILIRDWLIAHNRPLLVALPNLVQHRGEPSATSPRYHRHTSPSFGRG